MHKDAHFGSLQHDDKFRADAELAWRVGSSWNHLGVDMGQGAGDYNALLFDSSGRPCAFYAITVEDSLASRHGVWAARREADSTWTTVKLHTGAIFQEVAAGQNPLTGEIAVAFYSAKDFAVRLRRLNDLAQFADAEAWTSEIVSDARYDEGRYVSLAFTPQGETALAYHRCKRLTSTTDGCDQNDEAVVFALQRSSKWSFDVVRHADRGSCGEYASLAINNGGAAYFAFRCTIEKNGEFFYRLFVAHKDLGAS